MNMKKRFVTFTLLLFAFSKGAFASLSGPELIEVLGFNEKDQRVYFLRTFQDESGSLPELDYVNISSPVALIKDESIYAKLDEYDTEEFDARIKVLRARLTPLAKEGINGLHLKTNILRTGQENIMETNVPKWDLKIEIGNERYRGSGKATTYFNRDVQILALERLPDKDIAFVVVSYLGIPYEVGYQKNDVIILLKY
jgi:hypothetical protein